jgi:hypothetical protein
VCVEPLLGVFIARQNVEVVSIDFNVSADGHVSRGYELVILVNILVFAALEELALHDARVLLGRLVNRNGVVREEELYDEPAVHILWHSGIQASCVSQDLALIVNCLEEVFLWLLGNQTVNVAEGVDFVTKAVVRRNLALGVLTGLRVFDMANLEDLTLPFSEKVVSELVDALDVELASEGVNEAIGLNLIPGVVVVTHVHEARLGHLEVLGQSLSLHKESEVVATVVRVMNLSDFNGVISQEVVDDEGQVVETSVEAEDTAIVVQELLLALHSATTKGLLHILLQGGVTKDWLRDLAVCEAVNRN